MNKSIHSYDNLYQLRQVQSKFDHLSTYCRCRAASEVTDGHIYQLYTIFTLADCDNCNEATDGRIASLLFRTIALNIFEEDRVAEEITSSLKKNVCTETAEILKLIINLHSENVKTIQMLENKQLNTQLESLALQIAPYITRANQHVSDSICQVFSNSNL
ncbi:hypothetical protein BCV71DRAFT_283098 [Rhizopus microsporus]|uniref:Uncharacterized protein n=1 Tax=Rhizopus microsporus TaxID=58291 RepID=A0A1X0RJP4_RHIZD|nr:hypothetical protein BCV71DRAFT_283098 [Rhizopus microsporus]